MESVQTWVPIFGWFKYFKKRKNSKIPDDWASFGIFVLSLCETAVKNDLALTEVREEQVVKKMPLGTFKDLAQVSGGIHFLVFKARGQDSRLSSSLKIN